MKRRFSERSCRATDILVPLVLGLLALSLLSHQAFAEGTIPPPEDGTGFAEVVDPARELFELPRPWSVLADRASAAEDLLGEVLTVSHDVPVPGGRTIRVREHFTLRSWLRWPKRAALFLTGTATRANLWAIPVEGYNGVEMAARRGFFAFSVDYIGVGDNYIQGENALVSTFDVNQEALRVVLRYIRFFRDVPEIDLVGESWGGVHATQLAADTTRVRSCVMSSMTYKTVANPAFLSPEFEAFLRSRPDNYIFNGPEFYGMLTASSPGAVKDYIDATQPGLYLTTQLWQIIEGLPHFNPGLAKVPGLVITGSAEAADGRVLADDYGAEGAELFEIEAAGHVPRIETPRNAELFWRRVFEFIDPR